MARPKAEGRPRRGPATDPAPSGRHGAAPLPGVFLTKSELARRHIQEMILSGTAQAGGRITSADVSQALGISETPVREAMRSLAAEGWLDAQTHLGVAVASVGSEQVREVYALRGALGALAIELGGTCYTPAILARIDRNLEEAGAAVSAQDARLYGRLNHEFHLLLCDTPATQWTLRLLTGVSARSSAFRLGFGVLPGRMRQSLDEHRAIRRAIRDREFGRAASLVAEHERAAGAALVAVLSSDPREADRN